MEDLVVCSHCKKEVAKANLPMHEVHCQRFLCLCPDCDEPVPKEQLEEHRVEQHTLVRCKMCKKKMQKCQIPDHETDECTERLQSCEICELELPLSALEDHVLTCGSRTERCPDCKQYIKLKDRTQHAQICSADLEDTYDKESTYEEKKHDQADNLQDDQKVKNSRMLIHNPTDYSTGFNEDLNPEAFPELNFSFHQKKKGIVAVGREDVDRISPCPHCHLALPLPTLEWHEEKCNIVKYLKLAEETQK